eukprot:m.1638465 g.1638465  ORF g.1638465 m.1638465 type:complete len:58 (-) comp28056_c0_seq1:199-372(-)
MTPVSVQFGNNRLLWPHILLQGMNMLTFVTGSSAQVSSRAARPYRTALNLTHEWTMR